MYYLHIPCFSVYRKGCSTIFLFLIFQLDAKFYQLINERLSVVFAYLTPDAIRGPWKPKCRKWCTRNGKYRLGNEDTGHECTCSTIYIYDTGRLKTNWISSFFKSFAIRSRGYRASVTAGLLPRENTDESATDIILLYTQIPENSSGFISYFHTS